MLSLSLSLRSLDVISQLRHAFETLLVNAPIVPLTVIAVHTDRTAYTEMSAVAV